MTTALNNIKNKYRIKVYGQNGQLNRVFSDFNFLQIRHDLDKPGYYQLILDDPRFFDAFELDSEVHFERYSADGNTLEPYDELVALHRTSVETKFSTNLLQKTSFGRGIMDLVNRRIIAAKAEVEAILGTQVGAKVDATVDQAIATYFWQHLGDEARETMGRIRDGYVPNITYSFPQGTGGVNWSGDRAYRNLLDVIREISLYSYANSPDYYDYQMVALAPYVYDFQILKGGLGDDHTIDNGVNSEIVFDVRYANIQDIWYSYTRSEEKNRVYSLGAGDGTVRTVVVVDDLDKQPTYLGGTGSSDTSPYNVIEIARNGSGQQTNTDLQVFAYQHLVKNRVDPTVSFVPVQTRQRMYGKDYKLGDKVTVLFDDKRVDTRIVAVEILYTSDGKELVKLEFNDVPLDVSAALYTVTYDESIENYALSQLDYVQGQISSIWDIIEESMTK